MNVKITIENSTEGKRLVCLVVGDTHILLDRREALMVIAGLSSAAAELDDLQYYPDMRLM